jgi:Kef-type K+ transport system membrane component KefB
MAVLMSTTSIPMVLTTIRETEGLDKDLGQNILVIALVADIGCICLLAVFVLQHKLGAGPGTVGVAFIIPFLIYLFLMVYWIGGWTMWYHPERVARFFHPKDTSEQGVRMALAIVFLFVALSVMFNIEAILGAFLGGMFISLMFREGALLERKLFAVGYGFFIPIFFIYAGMRFDISQFHDVRSFLLVPLLLFIAIGIKVIPSLMFLRWHTPREVAGIGVLSSVRLVLILAVATVGIELGIVDELFYSSLVLMVVIICILSPTLFRYIIAPVVEKGGRKGGGDDAKAREKAREGKPVVRKEVGRNDGR